MEFHCGTSSAQKIPGDYVHTSFYHFQKYVIAIDQTTCSFNMSLKHTQERNKTVRNKTKQAEKKGLTVSLAAMVD